MWRGSVQQWIVCCRLAEEEHRLFLKREQEQILAKGYKPQVIFLCSVFTNKHKI